MRFILSVFLTFLLFSLPVFGQSEKHQTIIVPTGSLGDISETRIKILEKTFESKLDDYFDIVPKQLFEEALEKAFEELDYEECTEDQCIMMIQEMLQVENAFQLVLIYEEGDTQISVTWNDLDKKRVEEEYCEGCRTKELRKTIAGLVEKLVGVKEFVIEEQPKRTETKVVETPKVFPKIVKEPVLQETKFDKTDGIFVTVGENRNIHTSSDGSTWTLGNYGGYQLNQVSYGKGIFITVGDKGTILTSTDEKSWTARTSGTSEDLRGITYGNELFVTVGNEGTILTSSNGTTWTERNSRTWNNLRGVTNGNGLFVTVGNDGIILTSSYGVTWTERSFESKHLNGITFGNGLFVTVGNPDGIILTSSDGTNWIKRNSLTKETLNGVTYGKGLFVTVGSRGTIINSLDGKTWAKSSSGTSNVLLDVTYGKGIYVTVGWDGTILTSTNGNSWIKTPFQKQVDLNGITFIQ